MLSRAVLHRTRPARVQLCLAVFGSAFPYIRGGGAGFLLPVLKEQCMFSARLLLRLVPLSSPNFFFRFVRSATNLLWSSMKIGGPSSGLLANITMSTIRSFVYMLLGCEVHGVGCMEERRTLVPVEVHVYLYG